MKIEVIESDSIWVIYYILDNGYTVPTILPKRELSEKDLRYIREVKLDSEKQQILDKD